MTLRLDADFDDGAGSVSAAREFVAAALNAWGLGDLADVAVLLTSEVATNAVAHARTAYRLAVDYRGPDVVVEVHDRCARLPQPRTPQPDEPGGRGLLIVDSFADSWGASAEPGGKVVWFVLQSERPQPLAAIGG